MLKLIVSLCILFSSLLAQATDITELNPVEQFSISAPGFSTPMTFNVTLPASYQSNTSKRYFLIFDIHPRSQPYLSGLHDWLSHNGEWPWLESIIITPANYHKEFAQLFEQTVAKPTDNRLLDFIEQQLLAKITERYRTNGFNIYSGFMSNGAIGLYIMLNRPELFNAYMIASPTLNDNFLAILSDASSKLKSLANMQRFLYLSIGEHSYEQAHLPAVESLKKVLAKHAPKTLDWQVNTQDKHYYMSRPVFTVLTGIEKLFDDYHNDLPADSSISKQGVQAIIDYYAELSAQKYGFTISAEGSLKNLAKSYLNDQPKKAIAIYQQVIKHYPQSAYAYAALAAAYFKTGQKQQAIDSQRIAVEKSSTLGQWHQNKISQQLSDYQSE